MFFFSNMSGRGCLYSLVFTIIVSGLFLLISKMFGFPFFLFVPFVFLPFMFKRR
ncbi:hypothetical protein SAMN05428962_2528 [Paenibacillus sp. BC26]|nr:hypothetical protein SAMN05428962_2528 [Paenibacillus sp. BC26]